MWALKAVQSGRWPDAATLEDEGQERLPLLPQAKVRTG